ncbi:crotonase/enoyl-CoA hydratase family protein [Paraferrimonas haliotis]|uniref:Enoyl-CoA hydratase n=1 Tax=Paraferrimonas haliotis TaxID=2013866 RepID=A0AA37TVC1_9GAMM|nr:crotonase/enoyl-CoA hydratase family protein [Paraferrimonas haliotis]GLS82481.1 enoyl-CoA hydratase [Paraferrimonas haliotis]
MTTQYQRLTVSIRDQVAHVNLARPDKRNAIDLTMFKELAGVAKELKRNRDIRAVILAGDGPDFCSGLDVAGVMKQKSQMFSLLTKWWPGHANLAQRAAHAWRKIPVPVIVAIHGRCWGGGLQIALGGDFRLASTEASLSIMESKWGLVPDMSGLVALRGIMRQDQAMKITMSSELITAPQALELGLVTQVVDEPLEAALALAQSLADKSPDCLAAIKGLYQGHWHSSEGRILASETWRQWKILSGSNFRRAVSRNMGKECDYQPRKRW